jgi:hypothetical protein
MRQNQALWTIFIVFCVASVGIMYYFIAMQQVSGWSAVFVVFALLYFMFRLFRFN